VALAGATVRLELATPVSELSVAVIVVVAAIFSVVARVVVDWPEVKETAVVYVGALLVGLLPGPLYVMVFEPE